MLTLSVSAAPQSKKRQKQIEGLLKKSDLAVVAVARAYYPVIDIEKYRLERAEREAHDPRRRSKYIDGTAYKLTIKEVLYQKPAKDPDQPGRLFHPDDSFMIYVTGPPAQPLDIDKLTFFPSTEYIVFLKQINLDPDDFPRGMRQDLNAPMREWEGFPNPVETYFEVIRDPMAAKVVDDVWIKFVDHTRNVVHLMESKERDGR